MKAFDIYEHDMKFATIEARTPEASLNKAARQYPRRSRDYNGYKGPIVWRAFLPTERGSLASKTVQVR